MVDVGGATGVRAVTAAFQPIFDLRDGAVIGYEALARPVDGTSPEELFSTARAEGRLTQVDRQCRAEALRAAAEAGLGAPFALFLNADAGALELDLPDLPMGGATLVMEITETALTERPEAVLRTLTELRTRGWGVSLDDVGADSRSLAVMPLLYPDVIKLDLRLLAERDPIDLARIVTAVGAEAERRHATVLAEGIDSDSQLEMARAAGATLGQGFMLGEPAPLPDPLPPPGRPLRLGGSGGDPSGPVPFQRVTNWKRPTRGPLVLAERAAALMSGQASALGPTGMLLAAPDSSHSSLRYEALRDSLGFVGVLEPGILEDTWTEVALGPGYGACFVARLHERSGEEPAERGSGEWSFATSYDRELVVECALLLMARLPQSPPPPR
jgi:EAL domain-containing protein (putative c-di-GMP-specific phosphodiesterase class I)